MKICKVIVSTVLMVAVALNGIIYPNINNKVDGAETVANNEVILSDKSFDLKSGAYIITTTGTAKVYQKLEDGNYDKGTAVYNGHKLTTAGKYKIEKAERGIKYIQNIELYNGDGKNKANKLLGNKIAIGGFDGPYSNAWSTGKVQNGLDELPTDSSGNLNYVTDEIFELISDCGINLITWCNANYSEAQQAKNAVTKGLELADKYGMGMYVRDSVYLNDSCHNNVSPFAETDLINRIKYYSTYPSFLGINLVDEPVSSRYAASMKDAKYYLNNFDDTSKVINSFSNLTGYMNLYPYQDSLKTTSDAKADYKAYLEETMKMGVDVLAFDKYPFYYKTTKYKDTTGNDASMTEYFDNLSMVREYSEKYGKPFWTYIQAGCDFRDEGDKSTIADDKKDTPTESEMLWNINTCLAYGAKGIQYFPLIQPFYYAYDGTGYDFERTGLIGADGKTKTQWYEYAKKANNHINAISDVLVNSTSKAIVVNKIPSEYVNLQQVGSLPKKYISDAVESYKSLQSVTVNPDKINTKVSFPKYYGAVVGCFDYNGKDVYYVVNYNTKDSNEITLNFDKTYTANITRNAVTTSQSGKSMTFTLTPGEGMLVELTDGESVTTKPGTSTNPDTSTKPGATTEPVTTTKPTTNPVITTKPTVKPTTVKTPGKTSVRGATKKYKEKKVKISLKKISTASKYEVQFSTTKKFKKVLYKKTIKKNTSSLTSKKLSKKKTLYVRARAIKTVGKKNYVGKWSVVKRVSVKR